MKIGVELFHITEGVSGGLVPLLRGVLDSLVSGWPEHEVVLFYKQDADPLFRRTSPQVRSLHLPAGLYFPLLDAYASHLGLDVLLRSYPYDGGLAFPMARQVVVIPDLQHHYYPEFFSPEVLQGRRAGFAQALANAGAVATLSEHARQTLFIHPGAQTSDIFLMPPALAEPEGADAAELTDAERARFPDRDYFIYPANLWPHKNHRRVLQAFARFLETADRPFEFVFTGHPEGWEELVKDFQGLPVRHLGFVRRGFLQALLVRARALIFFSLFEGFGMPLLEAFAAGLPVACSQCTSLPEVGGDAVLTCDPTDLAAMSAAMARVADDQELRGRLTSRGRERLGLYHWHNSAAQLVAACARVAARAPSSSAEPFVAVRRLNELIRQTEADRAARLEAIHWLEAEVIHNLEGVVKGLEATLKKSNADLQVAREEIGRLSAGVIRRLARRLPGPVRHLVKSWLGRSAAGETDRHAAA